MVSGWAAGLIDLDQAPEAQRALGRERVPGRVVEERQREGEGRVGAAGIALGSRAEGGDAGVELHRRTEEQRLLLELGESQPVTQNNHRRRRVHVRGETGEAGGRSVGRLPTDRRASQRHGCWARSRFGGWLAHELLPEGARLLSGVRRRERR